VLDVDAEDRDRWQNLISAVRAQDIATGILSNEAADGAMADQIREWEFRGDVDAVVLSGEVGEDKPAPAAFQAAVDAIGV
uniref:hypothetical protein n=1 Tax=Escherichia coli TaxID=562 RepID=UPI00215ADCBB